MGFLVPAFLFGLAALAAPFYLHLLRRQTTTPRPFSSLMFFEPRTQASIRHRRLRYLWLLALRLALVGLLALAFADPYLLRPAASLRANQLTLLVVENSLSMRASDVQPNRLAAARRAAISALGEIQGRGAVAVLGSQLHLLTAQTGDKAQLRAALEGIRPSDERADFAALTRGLRTLAETAAGPVQVELFSDFKRTSLPSNFSELALPARVAIAFHRVGSAAAPPNWTVVSLQGPQRLYGSPRQTAPARFEAVLEGYNTAGATRQVALTVNGQTVATQSVTVPAAGAVPVFFNSVVIPYGWSRLAARLAPGDVLPADDAAYASVYRADPERILFVHAAGDHRSEFYFSAALGDAFVLESASVAQAAGERPEDFALVVLADLPAIPAAFARALRNYVAGGGGVLMAAGTSVRELPWFGTLRPQNYGERALTVASSDDSQPATAGMGAWQGVRFFYADRANETGNRVLVRLSDRTPLLMEKNIGLGHAMLFASGLDNLTNDLPLHTIFVPWARQTAHYLAGDGEQSGGSQAVDTYQKAMQATDPQGGHPLSLSRAAAGAVFQLSEQGFYQVQLAPGRPKVIAVNADRRESDLSIIPAEDLDLWRGKPEPGASSGTAGAPPARAPLPLWWYIMLVLLVVTVTESLVAVRYLGVARSEESVPEEGVIHERT